MRTIRRAGLFDSVRRFGIGAPSAYTWATALCILLCTLTGPYAAAQPNSKNVLVVFSTLNDREQKFLEVMESTVRARVPEPVNFSVVFLDFQRLEDGSSSYAESMSETLRHEFRGVKLDLVIVSAIEAIQFVGQYRDKIFPRVPIVFTGVSTKELESQKLLAGMTGLTNPTGLRETIDLALRLHPDTNAIAVVDAARNFWWTAAHSELLHDQAKVREIDILGLPSREMLERIAALPPHTVVLFQLAPQSSSEPAIGAFDILTAAAQHLPTYSAWDRLCLNYGCIGGVYPDWRRIAQSTGAIAARVLSGERPENIPIAHDTDFQVQVDWRALQRWHIPESTLPAGGVILYRPPSFWEQYRKYLLAAISLIVALSLLIVGLLWQRARRRKAEAVLRESEERFRVMADSTPSLVWMCDPHGKISYLNERRIAFTGPDPKAGYGDSWITYIHPGDVQNVLDALYKALKDHQPFSKEYRLRRSDGVYRRMFDVASPRVNGDGSFGGFIGSGIDVTDQKLAQQALENLSGQLIEAQERERSRIARDLHDDICQRLALLSMEIEQADHRQSGSPKRLEEIRKHCSEIAGDVQSLSHRLHSSKLDYLGVVAAIRGFCSEFSKQQMVSIEFTESNVPGNLSKELSLCLFRVSQEALNNAVKYSGVNQFSVDIKGMADEIQLSVRDKGTGFDVDEAKKNRGLGLVSMQERVHLVHGSLSVESQPGKGTIVLAVVPLAVQNGSAAEGDLSKEIAGVTEML